MTIDRVTVLWSGFPGAPGYTRFYWDPTTNPPDLAAIQAFFTGIADRLPSSVTLQVQNVGDQLDEQSGDITGGWSGTAQSAIVGTSGGAYAGASGAHINWNTTGISNGRRVRGRTFLVPLSGAAYDSDGTIAATALADLRANLATLVAAVAGQGLVVWKRPVGGANGNIYTVSDANIPDKAAVLRSRRD